MGMAKFTGHHGRAFSAWKQIPVDCSARNCHRLKDVQCPNDPRDSNKPAKRRHNRKSRHWFRTEIHHLMRGEKSKI